MATCLHRYSRWIARRATSPYLASRLTLMTSGWQNREANKWTLIHRDSGERRRLFPSPQVPVKHCASKRLPRLRQSPIKTALRHDRKVIKVQSTAVISPDYSVVLCTVATAVQYPCGFWCVRVCAQQTVWNLWRPQDFLLHLYIPLTVGKVSITPIGGAVCFYSTAFFFFFFFFFLIRGEIKDNYWRC